MSKRVIFWGNSQSVFSGRHFQALLDAPCDIVAVVDMPPSSHVSTNPLPDGIPNFAHVAHEKEIPVFTPADPNQPDFVEQIGTLAPDLFLAVGYAMILKPPLLAIPKIAAVNFHASLLPHYRGKHPVFWTLRGDESWGGLTAHFMDPGIDTGDIVYQVGVAIRTDDTVATLYDRIIDRGVKLVGRLISDAGSDAIPRRPQPAGQGSYFSTTSDDDFRIDWSWDVQKIRRHINMTPGKCWTTLAGRRVYLSRAVVGDDSQDARPGTVVQTGRDRCTVAAADGVIAIDCSLSDLAAGDIFS